MIKNNNSSNRNIIKKVLLLVQVLLYFFQNILYGFENLFIDKEKNKDIPLTQPQPSIEQNVEEPCLINMNKRLSENEKNKLRIVIKVAFEILSNK